MIPLVKITLRLFTATARKKISERLLFRTDGLQLHLSQDGNQWSFDASGGSMDWVRSQFYGTDLSRPYESKNGFDQGLQCIIKENCNVLKFGSAEFED